MAGELHDISRAIGALEGEAKTAAAQREVMANTLANVSEKIDKLLPLVEKVKAMDVEIEDFKKLKNKGLGIKAAVVFLTSGGVGAAITHWLGKW